MKNFIALVACLLVSAWSRAEDGHALWLRMRTLEDPAPVEVKLANSRMLKPVKAAQLEAVRMGRGKSLPHVTALVAQDELLRHWNGGTVHLQLEEGVTPSADGYTIHREGEGFYVKSATEAGLLYATYDLLRRQELETLPKGRQEIVESPTYGLRILNHWDNPNGTMERGYSGKSIWKWDEIPADAKAQLPDHLAKLYNEYARANASIGINATVLNNVNAKPLMLSSEMIRKTAKIADVLRPYGIKVCLAVNFGSPKAIGGLETADPLNEAVIQWWEQKAREIYTAIPDFGGFLVKANSEGEPGPMDYNRTHVDGANMLARALKPYGGLVMWRSFVYASDGGDRANQAQQEFLPHDGKFLDNVIIQVKNGPIDFQPREPISPLFFALKKTPTMPEFQITQEYTGHSIHTCFLAPMWKEFFTVLHNHRTSATTHDEAIAGVANIGDDVNWTGNDLAQANWYAFGRLAWNTSLTSAEIAREYMGQAFSTSREFLDRTVQLLVRSREAVVSYMMPLGLHHIFAGGHHYGPEPWCAPRGWREDWLPRYYHKADSLGLGFDRTTETGSANTRQYPDKLYTFYNSLESCPEDLMLWFHHVPWDYTMRNGLTLWDNLCYKYDEGIRQAEEFVQIWQSVKPYVDDERYARQLGRFMRQARDAQWWHDACLLYFQQFSHLPFPSDMRPCIFRLEDLMKYTLNIDNYTAPAMNRLP